MKILVCLLLGYVFGLISPAAWVSKIKKTDLRLIGTKNLGASNTFLSIGKSYGVLVMSIDILKSFLGFKIARVLFPELAISGILAGIGAIIGHIFPFYLKFKGGKGLAAFAGMILAFDIKIFLLLAVTCTVLMVIVNYSVTMPITASALFPMLAFVKTHSIAVLVAALVAGVIIVISHFEIVIRIKNNQEDKVRDVIKYKLFNIN